MNYVDKVEIKRRSETTLLHPGTLLAVALMIVNDYVLKSIWPESWFTGKLSDLALVVFAPPLIAFLLTRISFGSSKVEATAWISGYIGLPVLYGAYNTYEPLHDFMMGSIDILGFGPGTSPFDPTDSIVIPFGIGIALWIWRISEIRTHTPYPHLALLLAGFAAMVALASSGPDRESGIVSVVGDGEGRVWAAHNGTWGRTTAFSPDGGLTWFEDDIPEGINSVSMNNLIGDDPSEGRYVYSGENVFLERGGEREHVFSGRVFIRGGDINTIKVAVRDHDVYEINLRPYDVHYDKSTGNIIVALGFQGVAVGTPDRKWRRIPIGYPEVNLSFIGRLKLFLGSWRIIGVSITMGVVGIAAVAGVSGLIGPETNIYRTTAMLISIILFPLFFTFVWGPGVRVLQHDVSFASGITFIYIPIHLYLIYKSIDFREASVDGKSILLFLFALVPILTFTITTIMLFDPAGYRDNCCISNTFLDFVLGTGLIFTLIIALVALSDILVDRSRYVRLIVALAMLLMTLSCLVTYFMWFIIGGDIYIYSLIAMGFTTGIGYRLVRFLRPHLAEVDRIPSRSTR